MHRQPPAHISLATAPTEGDDVKQLDRIVGRAGRREASPVGADGNIDDLADVGAKLLDELDAVHDLLPELDHAVDGARDEEVGRGRHGHERDLLLVHQRLGVSARGGQVRDVELLVRQHASLLLLRRRCCRGELWTHVVIVVRRGICGVIVSFSETVA